MIFISYSWQDSDLVRPVINKMDDSGLNIWVDYQRLDLKMNIHDQLESALKTSKFIVFFQSKNSSASPWVRFEKSIANKYQKHNVVIPVCNLKPYQGSHNDKCIHLKAISHALHSLG